MISLHPSLSWYAWGLGVSISKGWRCVYLTLRIGPASLTLRVGNKVYEEDL